MYSEEHCVYKVATIGEADIVVAWLRDRGIAAELKDRHAIHTMSTSLIVAPAGIEVCVIDLNQSNRARELLSAHFDALDREKNRGDADQAVEATCEECGQTAVFSGKDGGTVQSCPHCGAYIDIPAARTVL